MRKITLFTFLFVVVASAGISQKAFAQTVPVTLDLQQVTIGKVLSDIEKQTNYLFVYNDETVDTQQSVTVVANRKPLDEVLGQIFANTGITWSVDRSNILLHRKPEPKPSTPATRTIDGRVTNTAGEPLVGVTVFVKGTQRGTTTSANGTFTLNVSEADLMLTFSYLGLESKDVPIGDLRTINVTLSEQAVEVEQVVVTALGIKREQKALSYNVQMVDGDQLSTVKSANFMNSLAGKVAGVQVNPSSGPGGAVRVIARGVKSMDGNNNVLYVVDGIPLHNSSTKIDEGATTMSSQPGGEGISDINPDDIESLSMLTGPAAAALYGYEGANGVVLITTKKGLTDKTVVTLTNNTTFSTPLVLPKFQNTYGNVKGDNSSWGDPTSYRYDAANFFQTGFNISTGVTLQTGRGNSQAYFSVSNTNAEGILPNNIYDRKNASFRYTTVFLKDKMTLDVSASYIIQRDKNMVSQGRYFNPLPAVYLFPRGEDFDDVRMFEVMDMERELMLQNWAYGDFGLDAQNPYWIMYRMNREAKKKRYMLTASLRYDIAPWLDVTGRVNVDNAGTRSTDKRNAGTIPLFANKFRGFYQLNLRDEGQTYADVIANFHKKACNFNFFVNLGASIKDYRWLSHQIGGKLSDDAFANWFWSESIDRGLMKILDDGARHQIQSVFANAEISYKSMVYLTLTGRNDWDSSLAFVDGGSVSFFYPSAGISLVLSEMMKMPRGFDFAKLRFARTQVGNGLIEHRAYKYLYYIYSEQMKRYAMDRRMGYQNPKHENTVSYEAGVDLRFLNGAITLDVTGYRANTFNQTYLKKKSAVTGYTDAYVQAGNIQNMGLEAALGINKTWKGGLSWHSSVTFSCNRNKTVDLDLAANEPYREMATLGTTGGPVIRLTTGGTMSDLYVEKRHWLEDKNGKIALNPAGIPTLVGEKEYVKVGRMEAKAYVGWGNTISYKGLDFSFQFRGRIGGLVVSNTQAMLDRFGVSEYSARLREQGVTIDGQSVPVKGYLTAITDGGGYGTHYIYDATNIRLGEVSLSYTMPRDWFGDIVGITVGVVGNNLAMIYSKAPFDPEQVAGAGNTYYTGVDYFMIPSTRNIGFNVKLQF